MSRPANPLQRFQSYSYHHILMICDNVETAESIGRSKELNSLLREGVTAGKPQLRIDNRTGGKFVMLVNGMTTSDYIITSLEWESITGAPGDSDGNQFTTMNTEGVIALEEPRGVRFLNDIRLTYNLLNSDPTACVWMIKTIFIGHSDSISDGSIKSTITNINPLIFVVIDLTSEFTEKGGTYNISFFNFNNGAAKLPQVVNISETVKINTHGTETLSAAVDKFESAIKTRYNKHFDEISQDIISAGSTPKRIDYVIKLDPFYESAEHKDEYVIIDTQKQNTQEGLKGSGSILDFSQEISIENALKKIMMKCPKVQEDLKGTSGGKFGYKIRSVLISTRDIHRIQYNIERYKVAFSNILQEATRSGEGGKLLQHIRENTLEMDYIFTGKNVDIIDFSMKMEMGLVFFQKLISSNNLGSQFDQQNAGITTLEQRSTGKPTKVKNPDGQDERTNPILPVFFSTKIKNPKIQNSINPKQSSEFQALLSRHAALENLNAKIKIVGNALLLSSINKATNDYDGTEIKSAPSADENSDNVAIFPHWERVPAFLKVNIKMPSTKDDDSDFGETFWYDRLYYVFSVKNSFNDGLFTQELEMISLPQTEEPSEDDKDKTEEKTQENLPGSVAEENGSQAGSDDMSNAITPDSGNVANVNSTPIKFILDTIASKTARSLR